MQNAPSSPSADSSVEDLKALLAEAEQALVSAGEHAGHGADALRSRLRSALEGGKAAALHAAEFAKKQACRADEGIRTHPYAAIGVAAGVGLLLGALLTRCACSRSPADR